MKHLVLWLTAVSIASAMSPQSFRLQSTSGIWEDDYDLVFDPARLPLITGQRVYTNLSNCVTNSEEQFGLNSSNFILVGSNGHLRDKYAPAALFDGHNYRTPEFTGLLGAGTQESLFGTGRVVDVNWQDLDSNGVYDFKRVRTLERNAWTTGSGSDLYLAAGFAGDKARFGVGLAWQDSLARGVLPLQDYVRFDYDSSLIAGRLTYRRNDTSRYSGQYRNNSGTLVLSSWLELKNGSSVGINLAPRLLNENAAIDRTLESRADHNPGDPNVVDFDAQSIASSSRLAYQGFQVPLNLTMTRKRGEQAENWLYVRGFFQSEKPVAGAIARAVTSFEQTLNPGDSAGADSVGHAYRGLRSSYGASVRVKELYAMGERFNVGWSLQLGARLYTDSLLDEMGEAGSARFDDGDSVPTHADYLQTIAGAERWLSRVAGQEVSLVLPVGIEFKLVPSVALRLGAQHTLAWSDRSLTGQLLSWSPRRIRTDFGDGSFIETIDTLARRSASSESRTDFTQSTAFSYGAGFRPLENLQIDLMGFANLVNLSGWRLSATLRF